MSDFVRRLLGEDRERISGETAAGEPESSRPAPTIERVKFYSAEGGEAMQEKSGSVPETGTPESYAQLGERVAAILKATEEAAEDIRSKAQQDADTTRREAETAAAAKAEEANRRIEADRREIEKQRSDVERRAQQLRTEADSYREQTRRQAEEEARAIRARADEATKQLHDDALRLREWMDGTLAAFHEVTDWLEDALAKTGQPEAAQASLEGALKPKDYAKST